MFFIIEAIILIIIVFSFFKAFKSIKDENEESIYHGIVSSLIAIISAFIGFIFLFVSVASYTSTLNTVNTNAKQYDIVEFKQSRLINNSDESYIITYKTKDGNEFKISADNNTNIVIDNDNPTKVTVNEELKYSDWFFAHKKTVTYTFQ